MKQNNKLPMWLVIYVAFTWIASAVALVAGGMYIWSQKPVEAIVELPTPVVEASERAVEKDDGSLPGDDIPAMDEVSVWYTHDDAAALAKLVWGEARGVTSLENASPRCQQAAVIWTVLNRLDAGYADTIMGVLTAPNQFHGYSESNPIDPELLELAYDVLDRWVLEQVEGGDVGRTLPHGYFYFYGDGQHNHFRNEWKTDVRWDWNLDDPYSAIIQ